MSDSGFMWGHPSTMHNSPHGRVVAQVVPQIMALVVPQIMALDLFIYLYQGSMTV